jgi:hypothetical protein
MGSSPAGRRRGHGEGKGIVRLTHAPRTRSFAVFALGVYGLGLDLSGRHERARLVVVNRASGAFRPSLQVAAVLPAPTRSH